MKYIMKVIGSNGEVNYYPTDSRDSKKAVQEYGAFRCIVANKSGKVLSAAEYSPEFGINKISWCDMIEIPEEI